MLNRNKYYGDLVLRKYESTLQRGEKWCDILEERHWIITPNAHEPIISRELFDKAQVRLKAAQLYCKDEENLHQWGNSSIRAVLNRNKYYGDLVLRKYESTLQRGEKWCDILEERHWIITPNAHEPIISRELFDKAQVRLKAAQQKTTKIEIIIMAIWFRENMNPDFKEVKNGVIYWMKASGLLRQMPMSRLSAENCLTKHKSG